MRCFLLGSRERERERERERDGIQHTYIHPLQPQRMMRAPIPMTIPGPIRTYPPCSTPVFIIILTHWTHPHVLLACHCQYLQYLKARCRQFTEKFQDTQLADHTYHNSPSIVGQFHAGQSPKLHQLTVTRTVVH